MSRSNDNNRILTYIRGLEQRLSQRVPEKHQHRESVYKEWLMMEIKKAQMKLKKD